VRDQIARTLSIEANDGEAGSQCFKHDLPERLGEAREGKHVGRSVARSQLLARPVAHERCVVPFLLAD
jgi:hypothetical protein